MGTVAVSLSQREFSFSGADFSRLRELVLENTGIHLTDAKSEMLYSRLARRLRKLGLRDFRDYIARLETKEDAEVDEFINIVTTNLTAFFREPHHFETMGNEVLPELVKGNAASRRIRIWSAGCSSGEEPYSIAITLCEAIPDVDRWDAKILATDLDSNMLAAGMAGVYSIDRIAGLSQQRQKRFFLRGIGRNQGKVCVNPKLRELIRFRRLNLIADWPMRGEFDVIFCRNVVIYFDKTIQRRLFDRYADLLPLGGWLFVGHSETLYRVSERFQLVGRTAYRRVR